MNFGNPQDTWYRNFLSILSIAPGKEFRSRCVLSLVTPNTIGGAVDTYCLRDFLETPPLDPKTGRVDITRTWSFPVKITGVFTASRLHENPPVSSNWKGKIMTKEVTVEK